MRRLMLIVVTLAVLGSVASVCSRPTGRSRPVPPIEQSETKPGDPPVLWLGGTLEEISGSVIAIREGEGPRLSIERFAAGATAFFRLKGGEWHRVSDEDVDLVEIGQETCVEALFDEGTFLALRVFLGTGCGPVP